MPTQLIIPAAFVLLWSTGFVGAKFGLPYAEPFTFLAVRLSITAVLLTGIALVMRVSWPSDWRQAAHIAVVGMLLHAGYLGGVFYAIDLNMPTGIAALIVGLQPVLTAILARHALGESIRPRQWLGLILGFCGVALTVMEKTGASAEIESIAFLTALTALASITIATVYQKRHCTDMDLISGTAIQYMAAAVLLTIGAFALESREIEWSGEFIFALIWLILVLSVGAVMLLMTLIKRGSASSVTSLFYLVPPITAVEGFLLFDEALGLTALIGMLIAVIGVVLVTKRGLV